MSKTVFTVDGLNPSLNILGPTQQLIFNGNVTTSFQLNNTFVPTSLINSETDFEIVNNNLSGYRWFHTTTSTDTYGTLTLQSFVNALSSVDGTNILKFNNSGIGIFANLTLNNSNIYVGSSPIPSAPTVLNDGIYSVNGGKAVFTSGTAKYSGTIVTINSLTAGQGILNGTTGATIFTSTVQPTSLIQITRNNGTSGAPTASSLGHLTVGSIIPNTSFTVYSTNTLDTFGFNWQITNS